MQSIPEVTTVHAFGSALLDIDVLDLAEERITTWQSFARWIAKMDQTAFASSRRYRQLAASIAPLAGGFVCKRVKRCATPVDPSLFETIARKTLRAAHRRRRGGKPAPSTAVRLQVQCTATCSAILEVEPFASGNH